MQFQAGIINENKFEALMKQLKDEKEASDKYEEDKEEMYGLNESAPAPGGPVNPTGVSESYESLGLHEGVDVSVMDKLMSQIKKEKEVADQYEEERKEYLQEGAKAVKEYLSESKKVIKEEGEELFYQFLKSEYGETPTSEETGQAIVNWAKNYMTGINGPDFEGVANYMNDDIWAIIKDEISSNYMTGLRNHVKASEGDIEESVGIKNKEEIDTEMGGIEPDLQESVLSEDEATQALKSNLDDVFAAALQSLPGMLKKADKDKDGLELTGEEGQVQELKLNEEYLQEVLGLGLVAANVALAAPGIIGLAGKLLKGLGSIPGMNINALKKTGEIIAKFGSDWQSKHMKAIEIVLRKLMPNASDKTIERATKATFITIMSTIALTGGAVSGTGAESIHGATNLGKSANAINNAKDLALQLAKLDPTAWKSKLAGLLPFTLGKVFG